MQINSAKVGFISKQHYLTKSFLVAGLAFLAVFFIGFGSWKAIDSSGMLRGLFTGSSFGSSLVYNANSVVKLSESYQNLQTLNTVGMILSIISMVTTIVWSFTFQKASKMFIFIAYGVFVAAQGIGFSFLFISFNTEELVYIFAIAGGLFALMAVAGMVFNMQKFAPFMIVGMIAVSIMSVVMMILYWCGIYSDTAMFVLTIVSGFMFMAYTAFDVWMIKRANEFASMNGGMDSAMNFRLIAFFSFRLLSDIIGLIWMMARIVLRNR